MGIIFKNCFSSIQNRFRFTGECNHPESIIKSCQTAGTQFLITNQKFNITYKTCPGMSDTFSGGRPKVKKCFFCSIFKFFDLILLLQLSNIAVWEIGMLIKITFSLLLTQKNLVRTRNIGVFWKIGMMIYILVFLLLPNVILWKPWKTVLKDCILLLVSGGKWILT